MREEWPGRGDGLERWLTGLAKRKEAGSSYLSMSVLAFILESMLRWGFDSFSVGLATGMEMLMPFNDNLEAALMVLRALKVLVAVVAVAAAVVVVVVVVLLSGRSEQLLLEQGVSIAPQPPPLPKKLLLMALGLPLRSRLLLKLSC